MVQAASSHNLPVIRVFNLWTMDTSIVARTCGIPKQVDDISTGCIVSKNREPTPVSPDEELVSKRSSSLRNVPNDVHSHIPRGAALVLYYKTLAPAERRSRAAKRSKPSSSRSLHQCFKPVVVSALCVHTGINGGKIDDSGKYSAAGQSCCVT